MFGANCMKKGYVNFLAFLWLLIFLAGCESEAQRKIKLSDANLPSSNISQTTSSVLQVTPEQQPRRAQLGAGVAGRLLL